VVRIVTCLEAAGTRSGYPKVVRRMASLVEFSSWTCLPLIYTRGYTPFLDDLQEIGWVDP
jgi:hypothetical protein